MKIEFAKNVILRNEKIHPILATMDDETKDAFFSHFYYYPTPFTFTRVIDNVEMRKTNREFISSLPTDKNGADRLVKHFFVWKQHFDGFEKKVLDILSSNLKCEEYLFLRSSIFSNNRESWEKEGIENFGDEIKKSYSDYLRRSRKANESLGVYYVINTYYPHRSFDKGKILANMYTHQLYDLRKTVVMSGFSVGEGFSLVPLMIKYEDAYETPIEEHEIWDGKIWNYQKGMLGFSVLFSILSKT